MNLLADEGVDKPIVDLLRSNGFTVVQPNAIRIRK